MRQSPLFIGTIFLTTRNQNKGEIMLGYLIDKNFWGNNYAKEAVYSLVFCLLPLVRNEITVVTATTRDDNLASKNILESFSFKCVEEIEKFGQKRLLYKLDVENIKEINKNVEIYELSLIKKNLGTIFLTYAELLENSSLYKYFLKEIIIPTLPHSIASQIENLFSYLPHKNSYWISAHFALSSFGYFLLPDPKYSLSTKFLLPVINTLGYSSKLLTSEFYQSLAQDRITNVIINDNTNSNFNYFDNCFYEVTLGTSLSFIFSLPISLSFTTVSTSYTILSTFSAFSSSALSCAASNKQIISPNTNSFSAKLIPYLADLSVSFFMINSVSFHSFDSLPEVYLNIKKTSFILSAIVSADQMTKAAAEMAPNSFFEFIDYFFGFEPLNFSNEVYENFDNLG